MTPEPKKKHPMRRRKRGKRGKGKRLAAPLVLAVPDPKPSTVPNLRARLSSLSQLADAHG